VQGPSIAQVKAQTFEARYVVLSDDVVAKKTFEKKCIIYVCGHFPPFASAVSFYDGRLPQYNTCGN
jgi:hypothetical protein